ncbi:hypothetical protein [Alicyclobacillus fodiniaquatilis]|uniref:Uncharacterized protein n=1 Tax=Alicyclobacillus fodiniaquatilis TaxID=1661150 RepID=A0ABW4JJM5_9BACL
MEIVKDRELHVGQKVRVYMNLNRGDSVFSIVDQSSGLVVAYANSVTLTDTTFKVRESGRQRVLRDNRKNVHAWAIGFFQSADCDKAESLTESVYYNPYKVSTFVYEESGEEITFAPIAHFENRRVWITPQTTVRELIFRQGGLFDGDDTNAKLLG